MSEEGSYNCPICLEPPVAARLTQCGHVYCWPCLKRLLHVAAKHYAPCPICTNIVTASRDMLKPAVVHATDPVKVCCACGATSISVAKEEAKRVARALAPALRACQQPSDDELTTCRSTARFHSS